MQEITSKDKPGLVNQTLPFFNHMYRAFLSYSEQSALAENTLTAKKNKKNYTFSHSGYVFTICPPLGPTHLLPFSSWW